MFTIPVVAPHLLALQAAKFNNLMINISIIRHLVSTIIQSSNLLKMVSNLRNALFSSRIMYYI